MDPMNESFNCEVGRDPEVGKLDKSGPGQCCECGTRAGGKAMSESEAPSNRQAGARVFNKPDSLA